VCRDVCLTAQTAMVIAVTVVTSGHDRKSVALDRARRGRARHRSVIEPN
jgi:hypothetical protein